MRPAVTLYEFMPYGAPELLESRQRLMSQALIVASATAIVLWALAGIVVPRISEPTVEPRPTIVAPGAFVLPPPLQAPAPAPVTPQPQLAKPSVPNAPPVPVPDPVAPPVEPPAVVSTQGTGTGPVTSGVTTEIGTAPPTETLPSPDDYVYVEELPLVVKQVKPIYPDMPSRFGIEGLVIVKVLVGTDGRVRDVRLDEKRQVPMLNEAALAAARQWVFTPGRSNGRPVACWTAIPFRFSLR